MRTEVQEEQIKIALRGNEEAQFDAICQAYNTYAEALAAHVREHYPILDEPELATAVNDVFIELAKKAKEDNFKTDGSLKSLLFRMVRCNAVDQVREKYRWLKRKLADDISSDGQGGQPGDALSDEEVASLVAQKLSNAPDIAAAWKVVTQEWTPAHQTAAMEIVRQFKIWIGTLPSTQRKVAEVIAIHYGDVTDEEICEELSQMGKFVPLGSVKSARREIKDKFKSLIQKRERIRTQ